MSARYKPGNWYSNHLGTSHRVGAPFLGIAQTDCNKAIACIDDDGRLYTRSYRRVSFLGHVIEEMIELYWGLRLRVGFVRTV